MDTDTPTSVYFGGIVEYFLGGTGIMAFGETRSVFVVFYISLCAYARYSGNNLPFWSSKA
jgi:hypothetical protein